MVEDGVQITEEFLTHYNHILMKYSAGGIPLSEPSQTGSTTEVKLLPLQAPLHIEINSDCQSQSSAKMATIENAQMQILMLLSLFVFEVCCKTVKSICKEHREMLHFSVRDKVNFDIVSFKKRNVQ